MEFAPGITAIVGPNGTGKSNIADALRWVLGEQNLRVLRSRNTEDLLFAGGPGHPPSGMAEVSIILDNASGRLPLPHSEVAITRRAYRSGENDCLINNSRARLRDVVQLLLHANLGRNSYAVIGQGMVDAALSARPEERRALLEDAADLRRYLVSLEEARGKLEATEGNLLRTKDIAVEIHPRLERLAAQAEKAERWLKVSNDLLSHRCLWYSHLLGKAQQQLALAEARRQEGEERVRQAQQAIAAVASGDSALSAAVQDRKRALESLRCEEAELLACCEGLAREIAVVAERRRAAIRQAEENQEEVAALLGHRAAAEKEIVAIASRQRLLLEKMEALSLRLAEQERLVARQRAEAQRVGQELATARRESLRWAAEMALLEGQLAEFARQRAALQREKIGLQAAVQAGHQRLEELSHQSSRLAARAAELAQEVEAAQAQIERARALASASAAKQKELTASLEKSRRQQQELQTCLEVATRWEASLSGYQAGVRAVRKAAAEGKEPWLEGVVGVVASLIRTPSELETAIEAALGFHAQDIVVRRWSDAEAAIQWLRRTGGGRAGFLPMDTLRTVALPSPPEDEGVVGVASCLVECPYQVIATYLLGNTLVVADLDTARRLLPRCPYGWQVVTLQGEVIHSSGRAAGGQMRSERGMLAHFRELRELPSQLAEWEAKVADIARRLSDEENEHRRVLAGLAQAEARERELLAAERAASGQLADSRRQQERLAQEIAQRSLAEKQLAEQMVALERSESHHQARLADAQSQQRADVERLTELERKAENAEAEVGEAASQLAALRMELAVGQQERHSQEELYKAHQRNLAALDGQMAAKRARAAQLATSAQELSASLVALEDQWESGRSAANALGQQIAQQQKELAVLEAQRAQQEEASVRSRLAEAEGRWRESDTELERLREARAGLLHQIELELGPIESLESVPPAWEITVPLDGGAQKVRLVATPLSDAEQVKHRLDRLREQLHTIGTVNPQASQEYQESKARYDFITAQIADMEQAAASLRQGIAELEGAMRSRFKATFTAVAAEFERYFAALFGGGTARLVLADSQPVDRAGIEIVAKPPGKRARSLAQLSGGERALTGVALLFALLHTNPVPFCVLDEVDAALDEANVGRFCSVLRRLAERTQFIVITHNRDTMEMADTLYGITSRDKSTSQVVSLRIAYPGG